MTTPPSTASADNATTTTTSDTVGASASGDATREADIRRGLTTIVRAQEQEWSEQCEALRSELRAFWAMNSTAFVRWWRDESDDAQRSAVAFTAVESMLDSVPQSALFMRLTCPELLPLVDAVHAAHVSATIDTAFVLPLVRAVMAGSENAVEHFDARGHISSALRRERIDDDGAAVLPLCTMRSCLLVQAAMGVCCVFIGLHDDDDDDDDTAIAAAAAATSGSSSTPTPTSTTTPSSTTTTTSTTVAAAPPATAGGGDTAEAFIANWHSG